MGFIYICEHEFLYNDFWINFKKKMIHMWVLDFDKATAITLTADDVDKKWIPAFLGNDPYFASIPVILVFDHSQHLPLIHILIPFLITMAKKWKNGGRKLNGVNSEKRLIKYDKLLFSHLSPVEKLHFSVDHSSQAQVLSKKSSREQDTAGQDAIELWRKQDIFKTAGILIDMP